ncbi:hypothetical protein JZ751_012904 [Albula glossodonta]|uniref:Uncharacterized protein n=1 Tax=Albula glossodonta TaxID=121402 RepID=A0A8T2N1E3_9TELE|nr:hypothetical protein JZ751_012904 [Albula glossodonta]
MPFCLTVGQSDAASPVNRGERIPLSSPVNGGERIPLSSPVNGGHDNHMNGDVESQAPNGGARLQSL